MRVITAIQSRLTACAAYTGPTMKISEAEAQRQLAAQRPGENRMGNERFQIVRKTYRASAIKGQPPVAITTHSGNFEPF